MGKRRSSKVFQLYIGMLVLLFSVILLTGCGKEEEKEPEVVRIGVCIYDEYDTFVSSISKAMTRLVKEKERETNCRIVLDVVSAKKSQLYQNDQVEKMIEKGYDVLCVNLCDRTDVSVIIDKAKGANIPIIFFNREPVKEDLNRWEKLYYVGALAEQSGRMQAQIITDFIHNTDDYNSVDAIDKNHDGVLQYVILEGEAGHQDALIRTRVCVDEIKRAGYSMEKLGDEIADWNRAQAMTKMEEMLAKHPFQIELVIANNDDMALGAIDALENRGTKVMPFVIGVDGTAQALEAIKTKRMDGTVFNNSKGQAQAMLDMAYCLAHGEEFPGNINMTEYGAVYLPYQIIRYENVQDYIRLSNE